MHKIGEVASASGPRVRKGGEGPQAPHTLPTYGSFGKPECRGNCASVAFEQYLHALPISYLT